MYNAGLCACGCGRTAPIAKKTRHGRGQVKGQPVRFIRGHSNSPSRSPDIRLWGNVERQPGDGCWVFTGARDSKGYGQIGVAGRTVRAHRLAWELTHGPIPEGQDVLHTCDNPPCVRLDHLHLGNQQINVEEMVAKGRQARGERSGRAKLTETQVREIRRLHAEEGLGARRLARRFGVIPTTITPILTGHTWAHLTEAAHGQP